MHLLTRLCSFSSSSSSIMLSRGLSSSVEPKRESTRLPDANPQRCPSRTQKKSTIHPRHAAITTSHRLIVPDLRLRANSACWPYGYSVLSPSSPLARVLYAEPQHAPLPRDHGGTEAPTGPGGSQTCAPVPTAGAGGAGKRSHLYYVARLGMQRGKSPENQVFLAAVVDQLEAMKRSLRTRRQITDEAAGSVYVRRFGFNVFYAANNEDTQATAKKFLAASYFLEILRAFGPLDKEVEETIKYAKFKAGDIVRALREGSVPAPGTSDVHGRATPHGRTLSPSTLSPQTNPILLSGRPSNFTSPAESPTTGAPRRAFTLPQPNYPPPPTESGSGSAPVSPRNISTHSPFLSGAPRKEVRPEEIALPTSGSSNEIPLPEPASPRKLQSPIRSPLAKNGGVVSLNATPVNNVRPLPNMARVASPIKAHQEIPVTFPPVIQESRVWPPSNIVLTRPGEWPRHALVSPSMNSTMTMDSTETFTSSQLRTVIKSGSMVMRTAPRATSPVKTESVASTSQQSESQVTESVTSEDESIAESTLMPVLTVVDDLALGNKVEVPTGPEGANASNLVAVASPVTDDWAFGQEMSEAISRLTQGAPSSVRSSPLSLARNTPIPGSPDSVLQAALARARMEAAGGPTVVIPQSPAQPSPTVPNMISTYSPSTISPVSLDMAVAQNRSFKSAAELIDMELSKVYGKLDSSIQDADPNDTGVNDEEGMDVEVESGSSVSSFSSESASEPETEASKTDQPIEENRSAASSSSSGEDDRSSVVSEVTVMSAQANMEAKDEEVQQPELKSLIKTSGGSNGGAQVGAVVTRKTVRFAPSVVGGLTPEIPKQILPPPLLSQPTSPPPTIIPISAVSHFSQSLARPKSLNIRPPFENGHQSSPSSPDSPVYPSGVPQRSSGVVGYVSQPPLVDGRPSEEFAIIPFYPHSMSASHPPPAVHNNPAYTSAPNNSLVRTSWNASPPQAPSTPYRRHLSQTIDRDTAALAQKYSRFAISSLNYMDVETAKKELRAALSLLEGETY
ncbi:vacuolar protein sorting-associated VTA1-like protein [Ceratobasidium theobromae]|uniref:Vacuolar protein sorting-associated VTA1-like protein n=1 Tax=Ceratobasidium theobromae TaxID=1582974 RepID=A0A5N5QUD5_9AGAM|nr:vacuolar protein sorting-associated VTA1-like protein [Ceratobasidium theobromae]